MNTASRVRYPALRHRNFTLIWSGLLVSNMGTWMQNVAQSWLIYKLTGNNPLYLGWLGLIFCVALAAFALSPRFWLGVPLLVVVGIAATTFSTMVATMLQLRVPRELRGRVMSLYTITLIGLPSPGALGVALLAHALGGESASTYYNTRLVMLDGRISALVMRMDRRMAIYF